MDGVSATRGSPIARVVGSVTCARGLDPAEVSRPGMILARVESSPPCGANANDSLYSIRLDSRQGVWGLALEPRFEVIEAEDLYRMLAMGEPIVLLDVRTEEEYAFAHIPGSLLIPLHELERRWREIPNGGTRVAVLCAHGVRSLSACQFLAEHELRPLYNLHGGLDEWPGPVTNGLAGNGSHPHPIGPSPFLAEHFELLPKGLALDLAMGEGRDAIYLATRGFDVDGVDISAEKVARARACARRLGAPIRAVVGNVEDGTYIIPLETYDVIVVFHYLHRPLFNDIREGLKPGGVVVYQTFTTEQTRVGGSPTNPAFLLRPGELKEAFTGWPILAYREGIEPSHPGRRPQALAGIIAKKPGS